MNIEVDYKIFLLLSNICLIFARLEICWKFNLVPFRIAPGFSDDQQDYIKQLITMINHKTCLHWTNIDETDSLNNITGHVRFEKTSTSRYCDTFTYYPTYYSPLKVVVYLGNRCFESANFVLHVILHALGFDHEHQRLDRNCYVYVRNRALNKTNYKIRQIIPNIDRFPYDKQSVMHYRRSGDMKALSERFYEWEPLGAEEDVLSDLDLWKIQYRFCGRPHYCEVHPKHCREMEHQESQMNCIVNPETLFD